MRTNIIKELERHLRTDVKYLGKGGFFLVVAQIISFTGGMISIIAFANLLEPTAYGQFRYIVAASLAIGSFTLTGLATSLVKSSTLGFDGDLARSFKRNIKWSTGIILTSVAISGYYFLNENSFLGWSFLIVGFFQPLIISSSLYRAYLNGKTEFGKIALFSLFYKVIQVSVMLTTLLLTQDPLHIVIVFFVSEALTQLLMYLWVKRNYVKTDKCSQETRNFDLHLSIMNAMKNFAGQADKIIIFQTLGATSLAVYAFASAPVSELTGIDKVLASLSLPKFSHRTFEEIQKTLFRKVAILMIIMSLITVVYILIAEIIFSVVFSQYMESVYYSQLLSLSLILAPGVIFTKALVAHELIWRLYAIRIITPTVQIVSLLILTNLLGLTGVVISILLTRAVWFAIVIAVFYKKRRLV